MPFVPDAYRRIAQETSSNSNKKENCPFVTESALILLVFKINFIFLMSIFVRIQKKICNY